jgi:iron complex outermembrane receptor protein
VAPLGRERRDHAQSPSVPIRWRAGALRRPGSRGRLPVRTRLGAAARRPEGGPAGKPAEEPQDTVKAVEEIVVTARRREESLQDTPIAISAFGAEQLEARQIQQTADLERITPSLQFKPAGQLSGNSAAGVAFIRGVGQLDPTAAVDPGVGIYIDDVYVGRAVGGQIDFGDVAGVEVLRGPQGTLFGRNTIGGAILVRTRAPEIGRFGGKAHFRVGEDALYDGFAAFNVPLGGPRPRGSRAGSASATATSRGRSTAATSATTTAAP